MKKPSFKSQKETKFITEIAASSVDTISRFNLLLEKYELDKALRTLSLSK